MGVEIPAATSLESPKVEAEVLWEVKGPEDKTGFIYSGKNSFKSGEGEFTTVGQGDSFAGSHAYLLLADVPGASANSGASITAEDSNGKAAFVATETRGTTEQEVAVGAGSELRTVLNNNGQSEFPQLPFATKRIINTGTTTSTKFSGGWPFVETEITHGLGVECKGIVATATLSSSGNFVPICYDNGNNGVTKRKIGIFAPQGNPPANSTCTITWVAFG